MVEHGSARRDSSTRPVRGGDSHMKSAGGNWLGLPQVLASSKGAEPLGRGKLVARKGATLKKLRKRGCHLGGQTSSSKAFRGERAAALSPRQAL